MTLENILAGYGLGGALPGAGRPSAPLNPQIVRSLTEEDLISAIVDGTEIGAQPLLKIRQQHHALARLIAQGLHHTEISAILGVSPAWISTLTADPTFAELVSHYKDMEAKGYETARADVIERLTNLGLGAMEEVAERLDTAPATFSTKELFTLAELALDRIGHGKQNKTDVNVTHGLSPETLAKLRGHTDAPAQVTEADRGALLRLAVSAASELSGAETDDWLEGEGHLVREETSSGTEEVLSEHSLPSVADVSGPERDWLCRTGPLSGAPVGGDLDRGEADGGPDGETPAGRALQALAGGLL